MLLMRSGPVARMAPRPWLGVVRPYEHVRRTGCATEARRCRHGVGMTDAAATPGRGADSYEPERSEASTPAGRERLSRVRTKSCPMAFGFRCGRTAEFRAGGQVISWCGL